MREPWLHRLDVWKANFDAVYFGTDVPLMLAPRVASAYQARGLRAPDSRCPFCHGSGEFEREECFTDPISVQYGIVGLDDDVCVRRIDCFCVDPTLSLAELIAWHRWDENYEVAMLHQSYPPLAQPPEQEVTPIWV